MWRTFRPLQKREHFQQIKNIANQNSSEKKCSVFWVVGISGIRVRHLNEGNKMKTIIALSTALFLTACSPSTKQVDSSFVLPHALKHCSVYKMSDGFREVVVVHCPNAENTATSVQQGKTRTYASLVQE